MVVIATLLYRADTLTVKGNGVRRLQGFYNFCIRCMLGVTRLHAAVEGEDYI